MQVGVTNPAKHIFRGMYPWLFENDSMVYFALNIDHPGVNISAHSFRLDNNLITTEKGVEIPIKTLTLNLEPSACGKVRFEEDSLFMQCRSNQVLVECHVPYEAVLRMWCPRDQTGRLDVMFPYVYPESLTAPKDEPKAEEATGVAKSAGEVRPTLKRVK